VASSGNIPSKRVKKDDDDLVDGLVQAIDRGTQTLADVIKEAAKAKNVP
jgi:hypothetical protein